MAQNAPERRKVVQISGKNVDMNIMQEGITESGDEYKLPGAEGVALALRCPAL